MEFVAKVQKDGTIKMPKLKDGTYVMVTIERVYVDPSVADNIPDAFKV